MTSAVRWAAMRAIFNVSLIVRDKVTRQCPQTTTFEEKGEPKRIRTEVPPLTSLTPYRLAKPAHSELLFQMLLLRPLVTGSPGRPFRLSHGSELWRVCMSFSSVWSLSWNLEHWRSPPFYLHNFLKFVDMPSDWALWVFALSRERPTDS